MGARLAGPVNDAVKVAYLDTQVVVWLAAALQDRLTGRAKAILQSSQALKISPIVLLELEYLYEIKRLRLRATDIVGKLSYESGLAVCDMPFQEVMIAALNEKWTRDPFDRVIAAQAKANGFAFLISSDEEIAANYSRTVW